jgi:hypothetical protein
MNRLSKQFEEEHDKDIINFQMIGRKQYKFNQARINFFYDKQ